MFYLNDINKKLCFIYLGPLIDPITAICQSKDEQIDWVLKIKNQMGNNCAYTITSSKSVSQNNLECLSDYFAHLVCKGVINRTLLKLILYTQYINKIDISKVVRRNINGINQTPYEAYDICNNVQHNSHYIKSNISNNIVLPRHCSSMLLKENGECIYGKKLFFNPVQPRAYQDLTRSTLYKDYVNGTHDYHKTNCNISFSIEDLKSKHLTIPLLNTDNKDSTHSLCDLKMSYLYDNNSNEENNTVLSQDFQYFKYKDQNSLRSSDSGLADITITQQTPLSHTDTSINSSEHLCKCSSLIHINSYIFEVDSLDKTSISLDKNVTYRSDLYAHWWLKKNLENSGIDSGKIKFYLIL